MKDAWEAGLAMVVVVGDLPTSCWIINLDWGPRLDDLNTHAENVSLHTYAESSR